MSKELDDEHIDPVFDDYNLQWFAFQIHQLGEEMMRHEHTTHKFSYDARLALNQLSEMLGRVQKKSRIND
jgi:hypothetical protein